MTITLQDLPRLERRGVYSLILVELANALQESIPASLEDPQSWEAHPVVSQYIDRLDDEDVVRAIELANGCNY